MFFWWDLGILWSLHRFTCTYCCLLLPCLFVFLHVGGISGKMAETASSVISSFGEQKQLNIGCIRTYSSQLFPSPILGINCLSTKVFKKRRKKTPQACLKTYICKIENFFQFFLFLLTVSNVILQNAHENMRVETQLVCDSSEFPASVMKHEHKPQNIWKKKNISDISTINHAFY